MQSLQARSRVQPLFRSLTVHTSTKLQQQPSNTRRDEKKVDERQASSTPRQPTPLDPSQLGQVGGGTGTGAPRTTW